ncbi:hypothetical protein GE115_03950 [Agromyces sp. CFH 90414]|uniref:Uncharacterized protein n=1 Tax=Agromyces agglutinans TaxID=2662258 RepID=A0A6I2F3Q1_9MICO|nr:hypothetical protein [Agromyces agglutinans]MRG59024.1 hypothetical protein [Agromyces agglutinans]
MHDLATTRAPYGGPPVDATARLEAAEAGLARLARFAEGLREFASALGVDSCAGHSWSGDAADRYAEAYQRLVADVSASAGWAEQARDALERQVARLRASVPMSGRG